MLNANKCRFEPDITSRIAQKYSRVLLVIVVVGACSFALADAAEFSIYDIQYTEQTDGVSPLEGQVIDCLGGVVTHKFGGSRPKLTIQDPHSSAGWGAIQVKDWLSGAPLFNTASVGDWVRLSNVYVEEFRGNTTLQCFEDNKPILTVVSSDNPLPEPILVRPEQIAAPVPDAYGDWYVEDHSAEKYEHMRLRVRKVVVTDLGRGKAKDNYVLQDFTDADDTTLRCWASDYMNEDKVGDYHPYVQVEQRFCGVEGVLEQYTKTSAGWDYYQLLTMSSNDLTLSQFADLDYDCDVDFDDFGYFAWLWLAEGTCSEPDWCGGADVTEDGSVDVDDLVEFSGHWLQGR